MTYGFALLTMGTLFMYSGYTNSSISDVLKGLSSKTRGAGDTGFVALLSGAGEAVTPGSGGSGDIAGKHTNPLPGWKRTRTDQGVDFYGGHKILAPENGVVLKTGAPGWPEGGGVLIKTASGKIVYFYEGLRPTVKPGQKVRAGQVIAHGIPGGSIEVGFADSNGVPLSHGEYYEGKITKYGEAALKWLEGLGIK